MATALLITPTLEEVRLAASKMGLPDNEAQRFFHYYESIGWRVGKVKMVSFSNALAGWRLRYEERRAPKAPSQGMNLLIHQREYERCIARLDTIKATYGQHQTMEIKDKIEYDRLSKRAEELRNMLGVVI